MALGGYCTVHLQASSSSSGSGVANQDPNSSKIKLPIGLQPRRDLQMRALAPRNLPMLARVGTSHLAYSYTNRPGTSISTLFVTLDYRQKGANTNVNKILREHQPAPNRVRGHACDFSCHLRRPVSSLTSRLARHATLTLFVRSSSPGRTRIPILTASTRRFPPFLPMPRTTCR